MSLDLTLHTAPSVPLEAEVLTPERLDGMGDAEVAALPVMHGNQRATVGDFFTVRGDGDGELRLAGDLSRVKYIGAAMSRGRLEVEGNVGLHLGSGMSGGEIMVRGNAGDWVGPEMTGGRITIRGNAGHLIGSVHRGGTIGMRGGEILIHGNAGNEIGNGLRNGLIAVGGDSGDYTGVNMRAGTIIVLGRLGIRAGAGLVRGTIASLNDTEVLPTYAYACTFRPVFLRHYLLYLAALGMTVDASAIDGSYRRYCGDSIELNRGELLLLQR
jgi:formylmethanofuran dehydrogenase subunit C